MNTCLMNKVHFNMHMYVHATYDTKLIYGICKYHITNIEVRMYE